VALAQPIEGSSETAATPTSIKVGSLGSLSLGRAVLISFPGPGQAVWPQALVGLRVVTLRDPLAANVTLLRPASVAAVPLPECPSPFALRIVLRLVDLPPSGSVWIAAG
jgi:hypothetical protein